MIRFAFSIATLLLVAFSPLATGSHQVRAEQAAPANSCISGVKVEALGKGQPSHAPGYDLLHLRVTFEPGGSIGLHTHPGSLSLTVESGALGYTLRDDQMAGMTITRAAIDGTPAPAETLVPGQETVLQPGDWLYEEEMIHSARNAGDGTTTVLVSGLMRSGEAFTQCLPTESTPSA